jgi:mRNA interferase RelE/StbE
MYKIIFKKTAEKNLGKLPGSISERIVLKIKALKENPRQQGVKKLAGSTNLYRIRIGDYRVIYSIFEQVLIIEIIRVGHRKDVYK